ncbi:MAG TPA: hypothetical protein VNZ85_15185 [Caulobacter sp.]|nr:hypothetical protein [Caulobacter sp.]
MKQLRMVAYVLLAALLTAYSAAHVWDRIQYLPDAGQAIDPQPWKTIWLLLSIGVVLCAPIGALGMWISLRRQAYGRMWAFIALQAVFPLIIGYLQRDVM